MNPAKSPAFHARSCSCRIARTSAGAWFERPDVVRQPVVMPRNTTSKKANPIFISVHKHEFVAVEKDAAKIRQPMFAGVFAEVLQLCFRRLTIQRQLARELNLLVCFLRECFETLREPARVM